ncbi:MAG: DUF4257 domain-containing protein [Anaerolineae bacterium]|nr:DUF4257 domain-containing protein [Anaerolineae bacterium]
MMRLVIVIFILLSVNILAYAQDVTDEPMVEPTSAVPVPDRSNFDPQVILDDLSLGYLGLLVTAIILGGIGGFGAELIGSMRQEIELPKRTRNRLDIGFWARIFIGVIAAPLALYLLGPQDLLGFVAISLFGGLFGTSILKAIEGRVIATILGKRNQELSATLKESQAKVQNILESSASKNFTTTDMELLVKQLTEVNAILEHELKKSDL